MLGVVMVIATLVPLAAEGTGSAAPGWNWYLVDTHRHSAFSGDARADIGINAAVDKTNNYNAVFLTDHDRMSSFQIQGANGNYLSYSDALSGRWIQKTTGTDSPGTINTVDATQVHSGSSSLHLKVASALGSSAQTFVYAKRAPGIRSGDVTMDFWVYPLTVSAQSGVDVSVSLGGDATTGSSPYGYTTNDGTTQPGKSTVLVWQIGNARGSSSNGSTNVFSSSLSYTAGAWNHYVINVHTGVATRTVGSTTTVQTGLVGLNGLAAAHKPKDYVVLGLPKIEASSSQAQPVEAFVDDFVLKSASPKCPAEEFVYRNSQLGALNGTNAAGQPYVIYPGREQGQNNHSNQFNFGITNSSQYYDNYADNTVPGGYGNDAVFCAATNNAAAPNKFSYYGSDNVASIQATGYPTKSNHPGTTETVANVVATQAHGQDLVEVRTGSDYSAAWDAILQQNHQIIGTYGSDSHEGAGGGVPADYVYAPTLGMDDLLRSLFEGRTFMAPNTFGANNRIIFNLDGSLEPYPARYPVYVSPSKALHDVRLQITGGLTAGQTVRWLYYNGTSLQTLADDPVSGSSYNQVKQVPIGNAGVFTYARAAIYNGTSLIANTQPIFFEDVSGQPVGTSYNIESVLPPAGSGCQCSVAVNKGITSTSYTGTTLKIGLAEPAGSRTRLIGTSDVAPTSLNMDGVLVTKAATLGAYLSATDDAWFYDVPTKQLYLQDKQSGTLSTITATFAPTSGDTSPPSKPTLVTATAPSATTVNVTWNASTDNTGIANYVVYRNGVTVGSPTTAASFTDSAATLGTTYRYCVIAYDAAGNASESTPPPDTSTACAPPVTTPAGGSGNPLALVQQKVASSSGTGTLTVPLTAPSKVGDALVAAIALKHGSSVKVTSVTDSSGGTWTAGPVGFLSGTNSRVELWYRVGAPVVTNVTATLSSSTGTAAANVSEWSGVVAVSPLDRSAGGSNASGATASTPSITATNATDLVIGAINYPANVTSSLTSGAFTSLTDFPLSTSVHGRAAYRKTTATGVQQAAWSLSGSSGGSGGAILALKSSGGGADSSPPTKPGNVTASPSGTTAANVSWAPSTDNVGVANYVVYRNGVAQGAPTTATSFNDTGLATATTYTYCVVAFDAANNRSETPPGTACAPVTTPDITPPSTPLDFAGNPISGKRVDLSWSGGGDNVALDHFDVYREGTLIGSPTTSPYSDTTGLVPATSYQYCLQAVDTSGNTGSSTCIDVTTKDDVTPSVPTGVGATPVSPTQVNVSWTASSDNVGVDHYNVLRNGALVGSPAASPYSDSAASAGTTYTYCVVAYDAAGNTSEVPPGSACASATTPVPDGIKPSDPTLALATVMSQTQIMVTWIPSTDNVGVHHYEVTRNGTLAGSPTSPPFNDTGLAPATQYTYCVLAKDAAGNASASVCAAPKTTLGDVTPPSVPTNVVATAGGSSIRVDWTASTDASGILRYDVYRNGALWAGPTTNTFTDSTVVAATNYTYCVVAIDTANNQSQTPPGTACSAPTALDTTGPTKPVVAASVVNQNRVDVSWSASTDPAGVANYQVYRNSIALGTPVNARTYSDTTAAAATNYTYCVVAYDNNGNVSETAPGTACAAQVNTGDTAAPTKPGSVTATPNSPTSVNLGWIASTDNVGVQRYDVLRNGALIGSSTANSYADSTASSATGYAYCVVAYDTAGNPSETPPGTACANTTTPPAGGGTPLFTDGFESGGFGAWTLNSGLVAQSALVDSGAFAARANAAGSATYAYKSLAAATNELYYKARFNITNRGASTVYLLRARGAAPGFGAVAGVYLSTSGQLCYRNESASGILCAGGSVSNGTWHSVMMRVVSNGAASSTEVWLDGVKVITKTGETYPTGGIGRIHVGDFTSGKTFDVTYDNVVADTLPLAP